MNQNREILSRLKRGDTLTPLDALRDPKIRSMRLAARCRELRQAGHKIETLTVKSRGKTFAGYRLKRNGL